MEIGLVTWERKAAVPLQAAGGCAAPVDDSAFGTALTCDQNFFE